MTSKALALLISAAVLAGSAIAATASAAGDPLDPSSRPPLSSGVPEEPRPPPDHLFDGNYTSGHVGLLLPKLDQAVPGLDALGYGLALGTRLSVITQFVDAGLDVSHARWSGPSAQLTRTELGVKVGLHPGFPATVFNSWLYDVYSGIHGYLGTSVARLALDGGAAVLHTTGEASPSALDWRPCLTAGAGADFPISPRDRSYGWWLTLRYELRWTRFGSAIPDFNLGDGQALILIAYRSYNNSWARMPRPF